MKRQFYILVLLFGTLFSNVILAQAAADSTAAVAVPKDTLISFDGSLKAKFEVSTTAGEMRFSVRNSRLGIRGSYHGWVGYRLQAELNNEGQFSILDVYGSVKFEDLTLILGQSIIPFENSYVVTPSEMMFANRAFIGKYFTPGSRDLGLVAQYKFTLGAIPFELQGGVFNGGKINKPTWTDAPSLAGKITIGSLSKFKASAKIYRYDFDTVQLQYWGADISYKYQNLLVQAEFMNRYNYNNERNLSGMYLQGSYFISTKWGKIKYLRPAARWDAMGYDFTNSGLDVNRATIGLDFGFGNKFFSSLLRFNFEQYFIRDLNADVHIADVLPMAGIHALDNKFTVELLILF